MTALLNVQGLKSGYGVVEVLRGVDLHVMPGELVALLGSNGAGKTTLMRAISGLYRPSSGEILFGGEQISGLRSDQIVALGEVQEPLAVRFFHLTVECLDSPEPCLDHRLEVQKRLLT